MNILIAVTQLNKANGGVSTHVVELCKGFKDRGHNVIVASNGGEYVEEIERVGIRHVFIPFFGIQKRPITMLKAYGKLKKIIKENKIDVVHLHGQSIIIFAELLKRKYKIPYVWTNHIDAIPQAGLMKKMHKMFKFPIISVSEDLKNYLLREFEIDSKYVTVVNNGVSVEDYKSLEKFERINLQEKFGIRNNDFVISLVGRLAPVKGHKLLLEAIKDLQEEDFGKFKNIRVLFAGQIIDEESEKYISEMLEFAEINKVNAAHIGFCKPREVFGVSDLSVLPSYNEGFAIVCIESFFMRCPVIRSNTPGAMAMKDVCLVFETGDREGLKNHLRTIITDENIRRELAEKAYQTACENFSKERMLDSTYEVYESIGRK